MLVPRPSPCRGAFAVALASVALVWQARALDTVVVINEIHYHPADGQAVSEFVELRNQCAVDVDLSGWRLSGGIDFTFPDGTVISGGGYVVVAADPATVDGSLGPFTGMLDNGGERIRLRNHNNRVMDEVEYDDRSPWPIGADGSGASLSRVDELDRGDLADNWAHSLEVGGTPGALNFGVPDAPPPDTDNLALFKPIIDGSGAWVDGNGNSSDFNAGSFGAGNVTNGSTGDNNDSDLWLGRENTPNEYFTLDLGSLEPIREIRLRNTHNRQFNDRGTIDFRIEAAGSVDGSNRLNAPVQILSGTLADVSGQDPITPEVFTEANGLTEVTARYLKFTAITGKNGNTGLNEIEVYGPEDNGGGGGDPPAEPEDLPLWINEVAGTADAGGFWVELFNAGDGAIDLGGCILGFEDAGEFVFPAGTSIAAGSWLVVDAAGLGLAAPPADGENLYLYQPGKVTLLDAVRVDDLAIGRVPDGGSLYTIGLPGDRTPGATNRVTIPDAVVINEIMYNHRPQYAEAGDPPTFATTELLGWNAAWRYNEAGDDLGASWASVEHAIGGNWQAGPGPLAYETSASNPPVPELTTLTNPTLNSPRVITYYFETEFPVAEAQLPNVTELRFTHQIDDGCIFYLNGQEVGRYDMPAGPVTAATLAQNDTASEADALRTLTVQPTWLVAGNNRLSVEVHQASSGSSDVVMGVKVDALEAVAGPSPPVPYAENDEEWIEIFNKSAAPVDLSNWELDGGVSFTFPAGTMLPAGEYLVVPRDQLDFQAKYPGVRAVGEYSGRLSDRGERVLLLDAFNNPADEVFYYDDKPWPSPADGGGSSMELKNPEADNALAASWAASDNSALAQWRTYEYTITAQDQLSWNSPPTNGFHELRLGLLEEGEVLIDDFSVVEDPGGANLELIANGTFDDTSGWRLLGTHEESHVTSDGGENVLKIVATDRFNYLNNLIEANLTNGGSLRPVQSGTDYRVRFRAKWLSGSPQFRFELYYNKLARLVVLDQPDAHGTPGAQNSTFASNVGPSLAGLIHRPAVPSAGEAITVSVRATDPDGINDLELRYSVNGGAFQTVLMNPGADLQYEGTIPGQSNNALVHFYVEATDDVGGVTFAPPRGPDSRAVIKVTNPNNGGTKQSLRVNMLSSEANAMHVANDILYNRRLGCTLIIDEEDIAYDGGIRLRGSMFSRNNSGSTGLNIKFPSDARFRGLHSTVTVRRGNRREIVVKHIINAAGGLHDNYNDIVQLNGHISAQNGRARMEMARFGSNYLDSLPGGDGSDGTVFKMEGIRVFQATQSGPESPKTPFPIGWVSSFDLADQGDDKETYRHNIRINTGLGRDRYEDVIEMCKLFSLSGQALEDAAPDVIDVDMWCRQFAVLSLCGIGDTYSQGNPHNLNFYTRPDGIVQPMPWDWDFTFSRSATSSLWGNRNVAKLFSRPTYSRLFHGHLLDVINTTFNTTYLTPWFQSLGACSGESYTGNLGYVGERASHVLSQLPAQVPFSITSNGGANFTVDQSTVSLVGDGWIDVREVRVNGSPDPVPVTWTDSNSWEVVLPVAPGANVLTLVAYNHQGEEVGTDTITVTSTSNVEPAAADNIVVSEIHYHPVADGGEEFIELMNIHPSATVDLTGVNFTNGIDFEFPAGTQIAPGGRLLVVADPAAFTAVYGAGLPVVGSFENGTALANGGERIRLEAPGGVTVRDFAYDDDHPWPESPDGENGASLVLIAPESNPDHSLPSSWRPSTTAGGNPGTSDATTFPGGDLATYALAGGSLGAGVGADGHLEITVPRNLAADDVIVSVETSTDLVTWTPDAGLSFTSSDDLGDGTAVDTYRSTMPLSVTDRWFVRIVLAER